MTDMPQYIWAEKDELGGFWNTEEEYGESLDHMIKYIRADLVEKPADAEVSEACEWIESIFYQWFRTKGQERTEEYREEAGKNLQTLIRAATKNMGDAVTRKDTEECQHKAHDDPAGGGSCSPATSCNPHESCESLNDFRLQEIAVLKSRCEGLVGVLEDLTNACYKADLHEELSEFIDGSLLDAAEKALSEHRKSMGEG